MPCLCKIGQRPSTLGTNEAKHGMSREHLHSTRRRISANHRMSKEVYHPVSSSGRGQTIQIARYIEQQVLPSKLCPVIFSIIYKTNQQRK